MFTQKNMPQWHNCHQIFEVYCFDKELVLLIVALDDGTKELHHNVENVLKVEFQ